MMKKHLYSIAFMWYNTKKVHEGRLVYERKRTIPPPPNNNRTRSNPSRAIILCSCVYSNLGNPHGHNQHKQRVCIGVGAHEHGARGRREGHLHLMLYGILGIDML